MATRTQVRDALAELAQGVAEVTGEGGPVTVVLVEPSPEFPAGSRTHRGPTGRVARIVTSGGCLEEGIRLTAPLPAGTTKILAGVDPAELV